MRTTDQTFWAGDPVFTNLCGSAFAGLAVASHPLQLREFHLLHFPVQDKIAFQIVPIMGTILLHSPKKLRPFP
jgi:hypothetical protein